MRRTLAAQRIEKSKLQAGTCLSGCAYDPETQAAYSGLYPFAGAPYKRGHVAADDHKHYLPGGLNTSDLPGKGVCGCAPISHDIPPNDCLKDATHVRRNTRL